MSWLLVIAGLSWLSLLGVIVLLDSAQLRWQHVAPASVLCLAGAAVYVAELVLTGARHG